METIRRLTRTITVLSLWLAGFVFVPVQSPPVSQAGAAAKVPAAGVSYHLSVPAAAFSPDDASYAYENHGRYLRHLSAGGQNLEGIDFAPVDLPQGATITRISFYFKDAGAGMAYTDLGLCPLGGACYGIISLQSSDVVTPPGWGSVSSSPISLVIDKLTQTYFVRMVLPGGGAVWGGGVNLEYSLPAALPAGQSVSLPPPAFSPYEDGYTFTINGLEINHQSGLGGTDTRGSYLAPLHLPDGATVTEIDFSWERGAGSTTDVATARLQRSRLGVANTEDLVSVSSTPGAGAIHSTTPSTVISNGVINNQLYAYWALIDLPASNFPDASVLAVGVVVKYQMPSASSRYLTVPLAGLRFFVNGYDYQDRGSYLIHKGSLAPDGWYFSPLNLPDGVSIDELTFYFIKDTTVLQGSVKLQRSLLGSGAYEDLAAMSTGTGTALSHAHTSAIAGGVIDNSKYGYWVTWVVPQCCTDSVQPEGLVISYGYRTYLPLTMRK